MAGQKEAAERVCARSAHRDGTMLGPPSGGGLRGELTDAARGGATERGGAGAAGAARVGTSWAGGACIWRFYIRDLENKTKTLTKQSISRDAISARRTKQEMKNDVRNEMYASSKPAMYDSDE